MNILQEIQKRKWECVALLVIVVIGIFLRTYHFHEWLHFGSDQARDVILVEKVLNHTTPWPTLGADASNTHFKLGPVYHYFQIISGKIFGNDVSVFAYPDAFFSILAIPLFYFLLRRYFRRNLSLILTLSYTVSFYVVEYARFAWNPNPIPFFVMLYLFAMLELLENCRKTHFVWIVLLGVSLGVGIQLHTLLLLLLPMLSSLIFLFLLKKDWRIVGKIAMVAVVALLLNFGQIKSEIETGGANTRLFLTASTDRSQSGMGRLMENLEANILNHAEANIHILSSLSDRGNFVFLKLLKYPEKVKSTPVYDVYVSGIVISIIFLLFCYGLLWSRMRKEENPKRKYFLALILLYIGCSFLIFLSIARDAPLRYFIHTTFVPFVLLGLFIEWLETHFSRKFAFPLIVVLFSFFILTNSYTLFSEARDLSNGEKGDSGFVVLGEAERMVDYIIQQSFPEQEAILFGGSQYPSTYYKSLKYIAGKQNFTLRYTDRKTLPTSDKPYFFINRTQKEGEIFETSHYTLVTSKNFGRVSLHQLKKE